MNDYNINATITADGAQFEKTLDSLQKQTKSFSTNMGSLGKALAKTFVKGGVLMTGIHLTTKALKGMADQVKKGIKLNEESQQKQKLLAQTLKVTGAEAWTTTEALNEMASSLQEVTNYSGEEITDLQTVLLGFKNITGDNFKEAEEAILDMATVMGMDLTSATQAVAKALDDPIKGLGSLSRQGFQFSETEKQMLEDMVAVGDIAKAQKVILDELNSTYGGAARAGAKSTTQLKNNWNDLLKEMGRNVSLDVDIEPAVKKINTLVKKWRDFLDEIADVKEKTDDVIKAQEAVQSGNYTDTQLITALKYEIELYETNLKTYEEMLDVDYAYYSQLLKTEGLELSMLKSRMVAAQKRVEAAEKQKQIEDENAKKLEEQQAQEQTIINLKAKYNDLIAKQKAQWDLQEQVTGEAVSNEEKIKYYQEQLINIINEANGGISEQNQYYKDQMAIIEDLKKGLGEQYDSGYGKKLVEQRIEALTEAKDAELAVEELSANQKIEIENKYNKEIRKLKEQLINAEMEAALKSVEGYENAEAEKVKIQEYYNNEREKMYSQYQVTDAKIGEVILSDWEKIWQNVNLEGIAAFKETFKKIADMANKLGKNILTIVKNVISKVKNIIKEITNLFGNMFKFDPSKALDDLLAFEDSILTFFVETLPQLPYFFESALQSISVLLTNIANYINSDQIKGVITGIINAFVKYLPEIMDLGMTILETLFDGFISAINENQEKLISLGQTIIKRLSELFDKIIVPLTEELGKFVNDVIAALMPLSVEGFIKALPEFLVAILKGLVKSLKTIINVLVNMLPDLIEAILDVLEYLITDVIPDLLPFLIETISKIITMITAALPRIIKDVIVLVSAIIESIPPILTDLLPAIVSSLLQLIPAVIKAVLEGVVVLIKNLTTQDLFALIAALGSMLINIAFALIEFIPQCITTLFNGLAEGINNTSWEGIKEAFRNGFGKVAEDFKNNWQVAIWTIQETFAQMITAMFGWLQSIKDFIDNLLNKAGNLGDKIKTAAGDSKIVQGVKKAGEAVGNAAQTAGTWVVNTATSAWNGITSLFKHANGTNDAPRGLSLVGEAGPELVRFNGGEQVLNARNTQKAIEGISNGSSIFNVTFNNTQDTTAFTMMKQLKSYQRNLAFNGVL